jgi:hypothetical protein
VPLHNFSIVSSKITDLLLKDNGHRRVDDEVPRQIRYFQSVVVKLSCVPGPLLASQIKGSFENNFSTGEGLMDKALKEMAAVIQ